MKHTDNYGFNKPESTDFYNVDDFNENMDIIDKKLNEIEAGGSGSVVYITQEKYDDLPDSKLTDDVEYRITNEGVEGTARNLAYDNTQSGIEAASVQGAIDELSESLENKISATNSNLSILYGMKNNMSNGSMLDFGVTFKSNPIVIISPYSTNPISYGISELTTTSCKLNLSSASTIMWIAIGEVAD
jgi:hypothetical protein